MTAKQQSNKVERWGKCRDVR